MAVGGIVPMVVCMMEIMGVVAGHGRIFADGTREAAVEAPPRCDAPAPQVCRGTRWRT